MVRSVFWYAIAVFCTLESVAWASIPFAADSARLDFGRVTVPGSKQLSMNVWDTSAAPLEIVQFSINGNNAADFSIITPSTPLILSVGGAASQIIVQFSPQGFGNRSADLLIETATGNMVIPLTGFGLGGATLAFQDSIIDFGNLAPGEERDTVLELYSTGFDTAQVQNVTIASSDLSFTAQFVAGVVTPVLLAPGDSVAIDVSFIAPPLTGPKNAMLGLLVTGSVNAPSSILIGNDTLGSFRIDPAGSIDFGQMGVGQLRDTTIYLVNTGDVALAFDDVEANPTGDDFTILNSPAIPFILNAGDSIPIIVQANPGLTTSHLSTLQIVSQQAAPNYESATLLVTALPDSIRGPHVQTLSYSCAESFPVKDTILLSNAGLVNDVITSFDVSDSTVSFTSLTPLPDTIAAGSTKTMVLSFTPSAQDSLVLQAMGGNHSLLSDTLVLQSFAVLASASLATSAVSGASPQLLEVQTGTNLVPFTLDTLIVHLISRDTDIASIDPASISIASGLSNVVISSIQQESSGYAITLASGSPISANAGEALVDATLTRFVSRSDSTMFIASIETPEKSGCIDWSMDSVRISGPAGCGSLELQNALNNRDLFSAELLQNPISGEEVPISVSSAQNSNIQWELRNALGQSCSHDVIEVHSGNNIITIPIGPIPSGTYFLWLTDDNGISQRRGLIKIE